MLTHSVTHSLTVTLSHTQITHLHNSLTHTLVLTPSLTGTHTESQAHTHTLSHIHTHTHTHSLTYTPAHNHVYHLIRAFPSTMGPYTIMVPQNYNGAENVHSPGDIIAFMTTYFSASHRCVVVAGETSLLHCQW
jgi:hypothetical protein